ESRYGVTPLSGRYSTYLDIPVLAANAGKRLPTVDEFYVYADGAPEGDNDNNDTAWSATTNRGSATTGAVDKAVSCLGIADAAGNLWEPCQGLYGIGGTPAWARPVLRSGEDSQELRGEMHYAGWGLWVAGGGYSDGARCGS